MFEICCCVTDSTLSINTMEPLVLSEVLAGLLALPDVLKCSFYGFYDRGMWYTRSDNPKFFLSEQEIKNAFIANYVMDVKPWAEMDDDELKAWFDRVQNEISEFPRYTYDEDEWFDSN